MQCFRYVILKISKSHFFLAIFLVCIFFFTFTIAPAVNSIGDLNNLCVHFFRHVEKEETTSSL